MVAYTNPCNVVLSLPVTTQIFIDPYFYRLGFDIMLFFWPTDMRGCLVPFYKLRMLDCMLDTFDCFGCCVASGFYGVSLIRLLFSW